MKSMCLLFVFFSFVLVGCSGGGGGGSGGPSADPPASVAAAPITGGTLDTSSGIMVVMLKGTWHDMGRQYGYLVRQQMIDFSRFAAGHTGRTYAQMVAEAEDYYQKLPPYLQDLVQGMAEGSGFTLDEQKIVASLPNQLFFPAGACSTLTAWGAYTGGGPLVIGRNMDWGRNFPLYMPYLAVVVFNPKGASNSVVNVGFVGGLHFMTAMNSHGLIIYANAAWYTDPRSDASRNPRSAFDVLLNSTTLAEVEAALLSPASFGNRGVVKTIADATQARVVETAIDGVKERIGNGTITTTNHFVDPAWGLPPPTPGNASTWTAERYANLIALGESYKGHIDAARMRSIFDTRFSLGGPSLLPATIGQMSTIYQVVAVPADLTIWVKAPGHSDWQFIDLNALFQRE